MEALDFAFGLRAVRRTELDRNAVVLGDVEQIAVEAVLPFAIGVALNDDGLWIVAQNLRRYAAEEVQCSFQAFRERLGALVVGEFDAGIPRIAKFRRKRSQRTWPAAEVNEVDLQLPAGLGLESPDWLLGYCRPNRSQVLFELRDAAFVPE